MDDGDIEKLYYTLWELMDKDTTIYKIEPNSYILVIKGGVTTKITRGYTIKGKKYNFEGVLNYFGLSMKAFLEEVTKNV